MSRNRTPRGRSSADRTEHGPACRGRRRLRHIDHGEVSRSGRTAAPKMSGDLIVLAQNSGLNFGAASARLPRARMVSVLLCACFCMMFGCGNPAPPAPPGAQQSAASTAATNAAAGAGGVTTPSSELFLRKAVFEVVAGVKDPFFPTSGRLPRPLVNGQSNPAVPPQPKLPLSSYIKLTGLFGSSRQALINSTMFEAGELGTVTVVIPNPQGPAEVRRVNIRCLEIHQDSVSIKVEGEPGEQKLRMRALP